MIDFNSPTWVADYIAELATLRDTNSLYRSLYDGKLLGVIAIGDHVDTGYSLAYRSGLDHRMSKHNRAWVLVHSPTLTVTPGRIGSCEQTAQMTAEFAMRELEPWYLGCSPMALFDLFLQVQYPSTALFVYPENHLVAKQEREFIDRLVNRHDTDTMIVITKSPVLLSDMLREAITLVKSG